ncbi:MAG: hypothetical protein JWQ71_2669 [Pedosphaera sp.]|nr:hypothetical protein [Pedosphaera sp.]
MALVAQAVAVEATQAAVPAEVAVQGGGAVAVDRAEGAAVGDPVLVAVGVLRVI